MNNRLSNIEVLRIIAMFLIVLGHFIGFTTQSFASDCLATDSQQNISYFLCKLMNFHVPLFVLITGYFGISFKFKSFGALFIKCMIYALLIVGFWFIVLQKPFDRRVLTDSIRFFSLNDSWWFINCYLQLFLVSPLLNIFIKQLSEKSFTKVVLYLLVLNCVWGGLLRGTFNMTGFNLNEFILLYMIGRYIKLVFSKKSFYQQLTPNRLFCYFCISELFLALTGNIVKAYVNPFAIGSAVCLLMAFCKMPFQNKVINWFASSALSVYLLTDQGGIVRPLVIKTLWGFHRMIPDYGLYLLFLVGMTCVAFVMAVLIDKLLSVILINRLVSWITRYDLFVKCNEFVNHRLSKNIS